MSRNKKQILQLIAVVYLCIHVGKVVYLLRMFEGLTQLQLGLIKTIKFVFVFEGQQLFVNPKKS